MHKMHNLVELSFIIDTSPQEVVRSSWRKWSTDSRCSRHNSCALYALTHAVIDFVTDNVTQKLQLIGAGHPDVEGVLNMCTIYGTMLQWDFSFIWYSQWLLSLIQLKQHLLTIYSAAYTERVLYNSSAGKSSREDTKFGFNLCLNTLTA